MKTQPFRHFVRPIKGISFRVFRCSRFFKSNVGTHRLAQMHVGFPMSCSKLCSCIESNRCYLLLVIRGEHSQFDLFSRYICKLTQETFLQGIILLILVLTNLSMDEKIFRKTKLCLGRFLQHLKKGLWSSLVKILFLIILNNFSCEEHSFFVALDCIDSALVLVQSIFIWRDEN